MTEVRVERMGITHYQASCVDCGWIENDHIDRARVRRKIRKHVRTTGHRVVVEAVVATHYRIAT